MDDQLSFIPLGGIGDVTRNMYLYEYKDQILIVDCGLGFADETMLGVDLLLPDISYLLSSNKKIIGLLLTHGHEDHIGALPFVLPQLTSVKPQETFPLYGTPLTAALANAKLKEFGVSQRVTTVKFESNPIKLGDFTVSFVRVTHSVPDSANIIIATPVGTIYHGSDYKFDLTPADGKRSELGKIAQAGASGVRVLLSDCLGAEREGFTATEKFLSTYIEDAMRDCKGKFILTTYSSNISRLNQAIAVSEKLGRKVCFVGRSLMKAKEVAQELGYLTMENNTEIEVEQVKSYEDEQVTLFIAGSQGQENSAMTRVASDEHQFIKLSSNDVVVFSADPIPGNEVMVNSLIDTIAKKGARVYYSDITDNFHVSGHGSQGDIMLLMSLTSPKTLIPIGGKYKHMVAYQDLALRMGHDKKQVLLLEDGQEVIVGRDSFRLGRKIPIRNVYVDEVSGEEIENFVLRDRQKLAADGVLIVMTEVDSSTGQLTGTLDLIGRGIIMEDSKKLQKILSQSITDVLKNSKGRITNWVHIRKLVGDITERVIFKHLHRRPLVLPVVIEV